MGKDSAYDNEWLYEPIEREVFASGGEPGDYIAGGGFAANISRRLLFPSQKGERKKCVDDRKCIAC